MLKETPVILSAFLSASLRGLVQFSRGVEIDGAARDSEGLVSKKRRQGSSSSAFSNIFLKTLLLNCEETHAIPRARNFVHRPLFYIDFLRAWVSSKNNFFRNMKPFRSAKNLSAVLACFKNRNEKSRYYFNISGRDNRWMTIWIFAAFGLFVAS